MELCEFNLQRPSGTIYFDGQDLWNLTYNYSEKEKKCTDVGREGVEATTYVELKGTSAVIALCGTRWYTNSTNLWPIGNELSWVARDVLHQVMF